MPDVYSCFWFVLAPTGAANGFRLPHPSYNHAELARESTRLSMATTSQPQQLMMMSGLRHAGMKDDGIVTRSRSRMMRKWLPFIKPLRTVDLSNCVHTSITMHSILTIIYFTFHYLLFFIIYYTNAFFSVFVYMHLYIVPTWVHRHAFYYYQLSYSLHLVAIS